MATLYQRPDTKNYSVCFYPKPGGRLIRASLGLADEGQAQVALRKIELLCALEKLTEVKVPENALAAFDLWREAPQITRKGMCNAGEKKSRCPIEDALRAYLIRASTSNVRHALADKISRLRLFFGSKVMEPLDPRPERQRRCTGKKPEVPPHFLGRYLDEVSAATLTTFLHKKNYSLSSKRHFREVFHGLFEVALTEGLYLPSNPYSANPIDNLPSFQGREKPVTVLNSAQVAAQYDALRGDPLFLFGCQLMIEGGFRLHEILALRHQDLDLTNGLIRLTLPKKTEAIPVGRTGLKTGERTVTMQEPLRRAIKIFFELQKETRTEWCFTSKRDRRMSSHTFGSRLRAINRNAGFRWTTQDFRHTFATNRIIEGWNLKTLAHEMGTSVQMLERHYAGYIPPPVRAVLNSAAAREASAGG